MTQDKPVESGLFERDSRIVARLLDGQNLQQVGEEFGLTRERIRQIAKKRGVDVLKIRESKKNGQARKFRDLSSAVEKFSIQHPLASVDEIALKFNLDLETAERALGRRVAIHRPRELAVSRTFTDDEMLDHLRIWAKSASNFRREDYENWAEDTDFVSPATLTLRFGSWGESMRRAGLGHLTENRSLRKVISDLELWACVVQYLKSDRDRYSFGDLGVWLRKSALPSAELVRSRLGKWLDVRETALRIIDYENNSAPGTWTFADEVLSTVPGEAKRREFSPEETRAALRRVAALDRGKITVAKYDSLRLEDEPSSGLIMTRNGGSWHDALVDAGLGDRANRPRDRS
ncbi:sigma factor-like helix-turn-helix DNA-binding protein [Gulosibacter molinativorax]|uniref:RNA polymerase sigma-70 region 4 domain-containing protein n=1 Tax=Gulosibacter molinativorax TaxID=256821 RepID=A0ABT7C7R3_9MICO|nr:sigma factor-like helix-turn-helix DNA-binding protein [Gulosibacter molinativorax]MDJ1371197.1 hypothetical protein [Gulosibacter molinativorax]QUY63012.1 Hypotetical protein [Gulosibacter molinativorax]